jgi:death-on-curing protein
MEIPIDEEWLRTLYDILISIYSGTDRPIISGFPIVLDYDEGMLSVCVKRPSMVIRGQVLYPHTLQRAAVIMHSIIVFHPFVDGNKRAALLTTNFYLHWNGYHLVIPVDADDFTKEIAKGNLGLNDILLWLKKNTKRTPSTVVNHWLCVLNMAAYEDEPKSKRIERLPKRFFFPLDALIFFRYKIWEERTKKFHEQSES